MNNEPLVLNTIGRNPNLYQVVSDQLVTAIREAQLPPGAKMPSERDLGEQFGVSRTVIREAVRHLSAKGVLVSGPGTGIRVAYIGHSGVSESLEMFLLQRGPLDPQKVNEVRECLELETVGLAARRSTDEQLEQITAACESMSGLEGHAREASLADVAFHRAIAEATGNELFLVLVDSLSDVLIHVRMATLGDRERGLQALEEHRRIAEALSRRDVNAAVEAMRTHLRDSLTAYEKTL